MLLAQPSLPLAQPGNVASLLSPSRMAWATSFGCSPAQEQEVTCAGEDQILPSAVGMRLCPSMQLSGSFEGMPGTFL